MKNYPTMKDVNRKVVITVNKNKTLARIYEDNKVVAKGVASCSPEDTFDFKTGSELALNRALEDMKVKPNEQEWVVVNRTPRKGDYVRIVNPCFSFDIKGDILKVAELVGEGGFLVNTVDHPAHKHNDFVVRMLDEWCYLYDHVEVVEPAPKKPEFRKITRAPKAGDYVRIVSSCYPYEKPGNVYKIHIVEDGCVGVRHSDHPEHQEAFRGSKLINDDFIWWHNLSLNKLEFYEKV